MKKILFAILFITAHQVLSQTPIEAGGFIGTTTYQGDLAEDHLEFNELNFAFGGLARYHFNPKLKARGNVTYGHISGSDFNAKDPGLRSRGWSYESYIVEMSVIAEFHPFGRSREDAVGFFAPQVSPYVGLGVGFINYDPAIKVNKFKDQNLFPESGALSSSISLPLVAGVAFDISKNFLVGIEWGSRVTMHDYLDGVSKNGNRKKNDLFIFAGLSITYFVGYIESFNL
ncbi:MAG: hypothetical protein RI973_860 [Bacteroidota bacterium]|jgi:hypothetical protein